jgi:TolB-like protein/AraC-like DNA-binding protein/Tfp pilus assembly protein PilF
MDEAFIGKLSDIVSANISNEHFGVEDLAREAAISRITLYRKIKSIKNQDARQFIKEIRLRRAMELLQKNAATSSEIAFMTGFGNPSYFNKCFHEFFGYPPGKVKREIIHPAEEITRPAELKTDKKKRSFWKAFILPASVLLAIAAMYIGYTFIFHNSSGISGNPVDKKEKSIAVLPFKNLTDTIDSQYFVDAIMEDVRVISRTSTDQFQKTSLSTSEIAKMLNVNYLVEGSCQKIGNSFNLSVHLIDAARDKQIWSRQYQQEIRETKDIFKVQSQVAQAIALALQASITPEEIRRVEKIPTANLTAYDFYQRGRTNHTNYWIGGNKTELERAENLYKRSLQYDSTFAPGYTGLARTYWDKHFFRDYMSEIFMDSVLILCNKALLFDNQLADAYILLGQYYGQKGDVESAISELDKALELNPNDWMTWRVKGETDLDPVNNIRYLQKAISLNRGPELPALLQEIGWIYACYGFPEKALQCYQDKLKLDGNWPEYYSASARDEFWLGNFDKTLELEKKGLEIDSTNTLILEFVAMDYQWLGRYSESLEYFKKWFEILKSKGVLADGYYFRDNYLFNMMHRIGYAYWQNGFKEKAEYYFNEQIKYCNMVIKLGREYSRVHDAYYDLAGVYAFRGNKEKALENLRKYNQVKQTYQWMVMLFKTDPLLESIRSEPEFKQLFKQTETTYLADHEKLKKWLAQQGQL